MKAKQENICVKYSHIGDLEDLHIELFADASLGNTEKNLESKSVMGLVVLLKGKDENVNPLNWRSKVIDKVAEDIKTAETLALETAIDESIHLADMISEIYTDDSNTTKLLIIVNADSKLLVESLYSTKKVRRKTMRVVISSIQQQMKRGRIKTIKHVNSKQQLADVMTKKGVSPDNILDIVTRGTLDFDAHY